MHGTYVNDRKIPVGQDTAIRSGDVLTFGNEVTRGSGTYTVDSIPAPTFRTTRICALHVVRGIPVY